MGRTKATIALMGLLMLYLPPNVRAEQRQTAIVDVAMQSNASLSGQLVNLKGRPATGTIQLLRDGKLIAKSETAADGNFQFSSLTGGLYAVGTRNSYQTIRLWTPSAAPPHALSSLLIVNEPVIRGNVDTENGLFGGAIIKTVSNPWVLAGAAAAGIAVPLATDNDDAS